MKTIFLSADYDRPHWPAESFSNLISLALDIYLYICYFSSGFGYRSGTLQRRITLTVQLFSFVLFILAAGLVGIAFGWSALVATLCALVGVYLLIADFRMSVMGKLRELSHQTKP